MSAVAAYDWVFEVESAASGTWLTIEDLEDFEVDYGANSEEVDNTVFADQGEYAGQVLQRGATLKVSGFHSMSGGARVAGQARVHTLGRAKGADSLGSVRWRHETETTWRVWTAYVVLGGSGGGKTDLTSFEATFTKSGAETTAAVS